MSHKHFTINERENILEFLAHGYTYEKIATKLKKHKSSISREIKRNSIEGKYSPHKAQKFYSERKKNCGVKRKLDNSILLIDIQNKLEKELKVYCYFANPYHSWERGTNENTNGLLRRYFPKGTDFRQLTKEEVNKAVWSINNRPRKCLEFKTPLEVFRGESNVAFNLTM